MDNLRLFLDQHCKRKNLLSGSESWDRLKRKLYQLRDQDLVMNAALKGSLNDYWDDKQNLDIITKSRIKIFDTASQKCQHPFALLPDELKGLCEQAIQDLRRFISANLLLKHELTKDILSTEAIFPLELIWKLHCAEILQISTYVFRIYQTRRECNLSTSIFWLLSHSEDSSDYVQMVIDTFASLIVASQSGPLNIHLSSACSASLKKCVDSVVNSVMQSPKQPELLVDISYLASPELHIAVGSDAMERFAMTHLLHILNTDGAPYSIQTLLSAVEIQEKTTFKIVSGSIQKLIGLTINFLDIKKIINQLAAALIKPLINWRAIFLVTAALLEKDQDCGENFRSLTDELIQVGLEGGRQTELIAGFLLARHCCTCDSKNFSSYPLWFSSHFGSDSATARNPVQFQSLMHLLTDIVPAESAENLRVHINKVPQAPTSCNSILHDYTILARTRLADLNESSEMAGLFADSRRDSHMGLASRQGDIVRVLQHFQETKEIMKPVLEASIFRSQYYRKVFLVELMGLAGSSEEGLKLENFGLKCSVLHDFVMALHALGKIPEKLFKAYTNKQLSQKASNRERPEYLSRDMEADKLDTNDPADPSKRYKKSLKIRPKKQ